MLSVAKARGKTNSMNDLERTNTSRKPKDPRTPVVGEWEGLNYFINGFIRGWINDRNGIWFIGELSNGTDSIAVTDMSQMQGWVERNANRIYERDNPDKVVVYE